MMRWFALLLLLVQSSLAAGQGVERFVLTSCPQISKVNKDTFNLRNGTVADHAAYAALLRKTFGNTLDGLVRYEAHLLNKNVEFYAYHIPTARNTRVALATLASKGLRKEMVEDRADLKRLLSDSIALHGDLRIRVRLSDADYPSNGYYLLWTDPSDGSMKKSTVPSRRDTLILSPALFGDPPPTRILVRLRNRARPGTDLAAGAVRISSPSERADLRALLCDAAARDAELTPDSLDLLAIQLSEHWFGTTYPSAVAPLRCEP